MDIVLFLLVAGLTIVTYLLIKEKQISHGVKNADEYSKKVRDDADLYLKTAKDDATKNYNKIIESAIKHEKTNQSNADEYAASTRSTADEYATNTRSTADEYATSTRSTADEYMSNIEKEVKDKKQEYNKIKSELKSLNDDLKILENKVLFECVDVSIYDNMKSDELKNKLTLLKSKQKDLISSELALIVEDMGRTKKDINNQKKQILRCFNSESSDIIEHVTVKNVDSSRGKIERAYTAINKIFKVDGVKITSEFLSLKLEELSLVYAYELELDEEREQRRAIKEQMVEEEKVRREIDQQKKKLDKDETQFNNEVKKLMSYMQKAKDDVERSLYMDKIKELQDKLTQLQNERENVINREQNAKAGFVYIISNIGSFGENIYKIGMTRRLEPMDRIKELSSASVPFVFDVHAMIFSDNAPELEATLHEAFDEYRVNKVNTRKEFFHVDLKAIEKIVHEKHNSTTKFIAIPDATEYRETLKLEQKEVI